MRRLRPSLTPMIDVVFLLLLFFLLSTQLSTSRAINIAAGDQTTLTASEPKIDLLEIGDRLLWNDEEVTADVLATVASNGQDRAVAIRPSINTTVQDLMTVVGVVRNAGRENVVVVEGADL